MRTHKVFFTSDNHFFHKNIIGLCNRNFLNVDEMDEHMIEAWNSVIGSGDLVYHLGDFAITGYSQKYKTKVEKLLRKLNGNKILIAGNHDSQAVLKAEGWNNVRKGFFHTKVDGQRFILCHYAMRTWQFKSKGAIHLYGHSHGNLQPLDRSLDVGVDVMGYKPRTFEQIMDLITKQEFRP